VGKKIVFLDRDGVINKLVERDGRMVSPRRFADFEILPNVESAIKLLRKNNYEIVVVTNQPDISRGLMEIQQLEQMNRVVLALGVGSIRVCPHSDIDNCLCRKPKPGLIIDYLKSVSEIYCCAWMIGDEERDEEASRNAGIPFIRILRDREKTLETTLHQTTNLSEAVAFILEKKENS
jgi:D-glycero-D-manno-heptose 1,7-bisphosphate phosphatase